MMRGMLVLMQKSADAAICHIKLQQGRERKKDTEKRRNKEDGTIAEQRLQSNSFSDNVFFYL